jgi:hypothetical protein
VAGWSDVEIPDIVPSGGAALISARSLDGATAATDVDFWDSDRQLTIKGRTGINTISWPKEPGRYILRFSFPTGANAYTIHNGPLAQVR